MTGICLWLIRIQVTFSYFCGVESSIILEDLRSSSKMEWLSTSFWSEMKSELISKGGHISFRFRLSYVSDINFHLLQIRRALSVFFEIITFLKRWFWTNMGISLLKFLKFSIVPIVWLFNMSLNLQQKMRLERLAFFFSDRDKDFCIQFFNLQIFICLSKIDIIVNQ